MHIHTSHFTHLTLAHTSQFTHTSHLHTPHFTHTSHLHTPHFTHLTIHTHLTLHTHLTIHTHHPPHTCTPLHFTHTSQVSLKITPQSEGELDVLGFIYHVCVEQKGQVKKGSESPSQQSGSRTTLPALLCPVETLSISSSRTSGYNTAWLRGCRCALFIVVHVHVHTLYVLYMPVHVHYYIAQRWNHSVLRAHTQHTHTCARTRTHTHTQMYTIGLTCTSNC